MERGERQSHLRFHARGALHADVACRAGGILEQRGLAHPSLPEQVERTAVVRAHRIQQLAEQPALIAPADQHGPARSSIERAHRSSSPETVLPTRSPRSLWLASGIP
jgi:hypothetical protein